MVIDDPAVDHVLDAADELGGNDCLEAQTVLTDRFMLAARIIVSS